MYILHDIWLSK